ncbi:MAG: hypothetical protein V4714_08805 [Bacteroidota bacterium]
MAQQIDTVRLNEIRAKDIANQNDILKGNPTSTRTKSTNQFYRSIKDFFSRTKVMRGMYEWLFREPAQPVDKLNEEAKVAAKKIVNPNIRYDGKIIGRIEVKRVDVFGPSVNDTLRPPQNWFEYTGNRLHVDTRKYIIKNNYLLFAEGSTVDHQVLSNNERILRTALPNLLDARIFVVPRLNDKDTVDVLVLTQDVWSISVDGGMGGFQSANLNLDDKNLLGLGHDLRVGVSYEQIRNQQWGYRGQYTIPYVGKTYISAGAEYINEWDNHSYAIRLRKPFLAATIKYAGGLEISQNQRLVPLLFPTDTINFTLPVDYKLGDLWLGRSFRFFSGSQAFNKSARVVVAARGIYTDYAQMPEIKPDTNQYLGRTTGLFSVGFSRRNYFRDVYIYGFGRTEDVPYGGLINLTVGVEERKFLGRRTYGGINWVYAQYFTRLGYLYGNVNVGSFFRNSHWEQGALDVGVKYFSPLLGEHKLKIRQFITARYRRGINRFYNEGIDISNNSGIRGISRDALRGTESLIINLETVFFTPGNLLGFRAAFFANIDLGLVARKEGTLFNQALYQGYGVGIRIRNEHLAFNTFQFRIGYYPNIPGNRTLFRGDVAGLPSLQLSDLAISAPDVVPFQ